MAEDFSEQNRDYGLPKIEPQPINRDQPGIAREMPSARPDPEKKGNKAIIIALSVVGLLILASLLYMIFWNNNSSDNTLQNTEIRDRAVMEDEESNAEEQVADTEELSESESGGEEISEEPGSITTISQRTNRYYIFVGSYKFRAYARRHAEKLAADGFAVKLITPDNWVGMRVAVGNYGTAQEANEDARQIRSRYGNEVVISKY